MESVGFSWLTISLFLISRKDIKFAGKIVQALAENDLDTWVDWESIPKGEDWWLQIQRGIEEADAFLFLISPDSIKSNVCGDELDHAIANGKRILPIILREPENEPVPETLSKLNWIFCREGQDDFDKVIEETRKTIHTDFERLNFHTELQVKALKWQRNGHEKSLLLRGKELENAESMLGLKSGLKPHPVNLQREYLMRSRQALERQRKQITVSLGLGLIFVGVLAVFAWNQRNSAIAETNAKATALINEEFAVSTAKAETNIRATAQAEAEERTRQAQSGQLATIALSKLEREFDLASLLSIESMYMYDNFLSRGSLFTITHHNLNLLRYIDKHTDNINSVVFSPDGEMLVSGSDDGSIRLWDVATAQQIGEPLKGHTVGVNSVIFSPNGKVLASGSRSIRLWDVATAQQIGDPLTGHTNYIESVVFSPDGEMLASGSYDESIRLWDVATAQQIGEPLTGHTSSVNSVVFSPDGEMLASGSDDGSIRLWDVATEQQFGEPLMGHTSSVLSVAFSPDGETLASGGGYDQTIRLWDVDTGQQIGEPLMGHTSSVKSVAFSPDGEMLASGSGDRTIQLHNMDIKSWMNIACERAIRNFRKGEWKAFFPGECYRSTCSQWPAEYEDERPVCQAQ